MNLFFFSMTQRIEPFFWIWFTELNPFVKFDSKNWTFFEKRKNRLKELNFFKMIQRFESFFFDVTQRIELSFLHVSKAWLKDLILFIKYDLQELNLLKNMTQRSEPLFFCTTHRIELFWICLNELNLFFKCDSNSWTFFEHDAKNWTLFLLNVTQRIERELFWYDLKNWNFSDMTQRIDSKNWTFFS